MGRFRPSRRVTTLSARRRRLAIIRGLLLLLFLSFLTGFAIWLSRESRFEISRIIVSGTRSLSAAAIESLVREEISGTYMGLFPKSNALLLPRQSIETSLKGYFSELQSVDINLLTSTSLEVAISERLPEYLWCRAQSILDAPEECFSMDRTGFVFAPAPPQKNQRDQSLFRFYGFLDHMKDPIGGVYLSKRRLGEILSFLAALKGNNLAAISFLRNDEGEYRVELVRGPELILREDTDFKEVLQNIDLLKSDEKFKAVFREDLIPLLYIDLRLPNKVFFKRF